MIARIRTLRRLVAPHLAAALVAGTVLVPMMEESTAGRGPLLESEHHAATCIRGHDHTICVQVGANLALATPGADNRLPQVDAPTASPTPVRAPRFRDFVTGHRTRAPPLV